jgi:hypothetical protein
MDEDEEEDLLSLIKEEMIGNLLVPADIPPEIQQALEREPVQSKRTKKRVSKYLERRLDFSPLFTPGVKGRIPNKVFIDLMKVVKKNREFKRLFSIMLKKNLLEAKTKIQCIILWHHHRF